MEKKSKLTYLALGIGIGIILSSSIYSLFPKLRLVDLSEDQIIERAKDLGMVSISESLKHEDKKDKDPLKEEVKELDKEEDEELDKEEDEEVKIDEEDYIEFSIVKGEDSLLISRNLLNSGLIDDYDKFVDLVNKKGLSKLLRDGYYKISKSATYEEIIEIISKP